MCAAAFFFSAPGACKLESGIRFAWHPVHSLALHRSTQPTKFGRAQLAAAYESFLAVNYLDHDLHGKIPAVSPECMALDTDALFRGGNPLRRGDDLVGGDV